MLVKKVTTELSRKYPGKTIIENKNSQGVTTEIIFELITGNENPKQSVAMAVIDSSTMHYHKVITEKYRVIKGELIIFKYDENQKQYAEDTVKKGKSIDIKPGEIHSTRGSETWVEVTSTPAWFIEDYYNLETILKKYLSKSWGVIAPSSRVDTHSPTVGSY